MLEIGERVGNFLGCLACEKGGLEELKRSFEKFFGELEKSMNFEFSAEMSDNLLVTRSKCPIHIYSKKWCENGCIGFVKGFAKAVNKNIKVKRVAKQPESEYCLFEFEIVS